jgi:hypothetical protein
MLGILLALSYNWLMRIIVRLAMAMMWTLLFQTCWSSPGAAVNQPLSLAPSNSPISAAAPNTTSQPQDPVDEDTVLANKLPQAQDPAPDASDADQQSVNKIVQGSFQGDFDSVQNEIVASSGPSLNEIAFRPDQPDASNDNTDGDASEPISKAPEASGPSPFRVSPAVIKATADTAESDLDPMFKPAIDALASFDASNSSAKGLRIQIRERMVDWVDSALPPTLVAKAQKYVEQQGGVDTPVDGSMGAVHKFLVEKMRSKMIIDDPEIEVRKDAWNSAVFFAQAFGSGAYNYDTNQFQILLRTYKGCGLLTGADN